MEIYQWLLRHNGFTVNSTGYFVYCNGKRDREAFDAKLEFDIKLIPYSGDDGWVEDVVLATRECLDGALPESGDGCDFCAYRAAAAEVEGLGQKRVASDFIPQVAVQKPKRQGMSPAEGATLF
jgi:hypothetical protein